MTTWTVPATVLRVIDADTIECLLDLGWRITLKAKVRLAHLNAPERNTPEGSRAQIWVENSLRLRFDDNNQDVWHPITVVSHSLDKYGRVLGEVLYDDTPTSGMTKPLNMQANLGTRLLLAGHATPMN